MNKQKLRAEIFRPNQRTSRGARRKARQTEQNRRLLNMEMFWATNGEVVKEINEVHFEGKSITELKKELIQTATVCVAILEFLDDNPDFHEDNSEPMRKPFGFTVVCDDHGRVSSHERTV